MRILVDADGCSARSVIENIVKEYGCECIMFHDYNHEIDSSFCECRCVETGRDAVDFAIVKECTSEDIVITQSSTPMAGIIQNITSTSCLIVGTCPVYRGRSIISMDGRKNTR